jgi:hypothetical protein
MIGSPRSSKTLEANTIVQPIAVSATVFACIFGGAITGMILRMVLPEHHLNPEANEVIKLATGLITVMTALVLGLLISTAKSSYDTRRKEVAEIAADTILADRSLALYGSETKDARIALHELVVSLLEQIHLAGGEAPKASSSEVKIGAADFYQTVRRLSPRGDEQKAIKAEVLRISIEVAQVRADALAQESTSIPVPLLIVLTVWLVILFIGFGLFAPPNLTVLTALLLCAFSVSAAIFMVIEMDEAFTGVMQISDEPVRNAIAIIGK